MKLPSRQSAKGIDLEIERLHSAVEELKLLNEVALEASGAISVEGLLSVIIDKALHAMRAEQGSILLATDEPDSPLKTYLRQDNRSNLRANYRAGTYITGYVIHHRSPLLVKDLKSDPRFEGYDADRADVRTVLCVPVINQDRLLGVMMMVNKKNGLPFTEGEQRLLTILAAQSGQLIMNARLQEEATKKKEELALAELEAQKWRELDELKSRFFADISHEFRTPLALILGPLQQLMLKSEEHDAQANYQLMWRNARRLLRLINQLLDSARLEAGSLRLRVSEGDIVALVRSTVNSFQPLARQKGIALRFTSLLEEVPVWSDPDIVETILYNLLSNALKFTAEKGIVQVELAWIQSGAKEREAVRVTVTDNGRGIPSNQLDRLFDRYYQVHDEDRKSGSGLGLALAKGLVELHHGQISVTSNEGQGSAFSVELPVSRASFAPEEIVTFQAEVADSPGMPAELVDGISEQGDTLQVSAAGSTVEKLPFMLIVEDDADMRCHLREYFRKSFKIFEAGDAGVALSTAQEVIPDIVISDVAMPDFDGIQLCRQLKCDERTSHIPVLLLTAQATREARIAGLEAGADDYLTKPFDWQELHARVHNLIEGRRALRERFSRSVALSAFEVAVNSMDRVFLQKVMAVVERKMGNEEFGVEDLAREIAMSYSQLHRKLTALVNQSPNQFIRSMRLQRAKDLIEQDAATVSEISYTVGFASPAYFTKCFHEQFGIVPSQVKPRITRISTD